jgi:hypothetical protein
MSLCALCRSIPFETLDSIPRCWDEHLVAQYSKDPATLLLFTYLLDRKVFSPPSEPFGFLHHNSLEILAVSAQKCRLCDLLHESLAAFVTSYHTADDDPSFHLDGKGLGLPSELQLVLARRINDGDGFSILMHGRPERSPYLHSLYILGAVSFCVEDGGF